MAGHSKWANIKHRKAGQDAQRGAQFTKVAKLIVVAVKEKGPDPDTNPQLRLAIDKAKAVNMPKDKIEKAIIKGSGPQDDTVLESIRYEGYGPAGSAVMVDCLTDNRNRTVAEVRHAFSKQGGNLGTAGAVAYLFNQQGVIWLDDSVSEDTLMNVALEAGAEDVEEVDEQGWMVRTAPSEYLNVYDALIAAELPIQSGEVTWLAENPQSLEEEDGMKVQRLLDMLDDLDDVVAVYTNLG